MRVEGGVVLLTLALFVKLDTYNGSSGRLPSRPKGRRNKGKKSRPRDPSGPSNGRPMD